MLMNKKDVYGHFVMSFYKKGKLVRVIEQFRSNMGSIERCILPYVEREFKFDSVEIMECPSMKIGRQFTKHLLGKNKAGAKIVESNAHLFTKKK